MNYLITINIGGIRGYEYYTVFAASEEEAGKIAKRLIKKMQEPYHQKLSGTGIDELSEIEAIEEI